MNQYYTVIEYIRASFASDIDVNTITHGTVNETDIDKKNIFPLVHIETTGAGLPNGLIVFNFTINALDIRNISKEKVTDKFLSNDNELDNLNTMFAVINRFLTRLRIQDNDFDIELVQNTSPEPVTYAFTNALDGWSVDIQLSIPNTITVC